MLSGAVTPASVSVVGAGIAAATAAHCLTNRGIAVARGAPPASLRNGAPAVMSGEQAQILLRDVFAGHATLVHELDVAHRITRRIVRWGNDDAHVLPHSALVIAWDRLGAALPCGNTGKGTLRFALPTVATPTSTLSRFGQREAAATPVVLQPGADSHAALVKAIAHGWLFLIPTGA